MGEDDDSTGKDTSRTHAGNGATDNESDGGRSDSAEETAYFKDKDGHKKCPFNVKEAINNTVNRLQTG